MEKSDRLLINAAELYYQEDLSQSEIAERLMISRATVSRLLEEARRKKIVEITVHSPFHKNIKEAAKIKERFGLRHVIVVSTALTFDKSMENCGKAAAELLSSILENNSILGITWGRAVRSTLTELAEDDSFNNLHIAQMVGCLGNDNSKLGGLDLALGFANKLHATYSNIYVPVEVSNDQLYQSLSEEYMVKQAIGYAENAKIVLTGIGNPSDEKTSLFRTGLYSIEEKKILRDKGARAIVLGRWIDEHGKEINLPGHCIMAASLDTMKKAQCSIGISVSADYADAVLAAINGGHINMLIIDEELAAALLEKSKK